MRRNTTEGTIYTAFLDISHKIKKACAWRFFRREFCARDVCANIQYVLETCAAHAVNIE